MQAAGCPSADEKDPAAQEAQVEDRTAPSAVEKRPARQSVQADEAGAPVPVP